MSEYPAITRIRPISASSAASERKAPRGLSANPVSAESGASAAIALGALIVGLGVNGVAPRRN